MGCVLVKKYHVEFDLETDVAPSEWHDTGRYYLYGIPSDAVITEVIPVAEPGWYMRREGLGEGAFEGWSVHHWSAEDIEDFGGGAFAQDYVRMNVPSFWYGDPSPEEPKVPEYTDGYYWGVANGDPDKFKEPWRRLDGIWSWKSTAGTWYESGYSDEDIEESMTFVPEEDED